MPYSAIWDTGATNTGITSRVVEECGLVPSRVALVSGVHGTQPALVYLVDVHLRNMHFLEVEVTETIGLEDSGADVLIGMDIIGCGDFAVSNFEGKTAFTFRIPSIEKLDFTAQRQSSS